MDRRILILSNPTSGSYSTRFVDLVRRGIESHGGHSELQATTSVEDLRTRAKAAVGTWDVVAAYGGDGTINHVAAAVLGSPIGVGVIPGRYGERDGQGAGRSATALRGSVRCWRRPDRLRHPLGS